MDQKKKQLLVFGYGWALILTVIAYRQSVKHGFGPILRFYYLAAAAMLLMTLFKRDWLVEMYNPWMKAMYGIGTIVNAILMTIIFYLIFAPVGLFLRLIGKDLLNRKMDAQAKSYWILRDTKLTNRSRYTQQF